MDWADNDDPILSGYAKRLVSRRDYHKSIRIGELTAEMSSVVIPKILPILEEAGFSSSDVITASIMQKGYKPYSQGIICLLYTSPSPRDATLSRMPSSA